MQMIGHVIVNGEKIKVLARISRTQHTLKLRVSGKDGDFLEAESESLSENPNILTALKAGKAIGGNIPPY